MPLMKLKDEELVVESKLLPDIDSIGEIEETQSFIGRKRAVRSLIFGLDMEKSGYNIFVVGLSGTGRKTFVKHFVSEYSQKKPVPSDVAYVMDFEDPQRAKVIFLPSGRGIDFKKDMEKLVENLTEKISKVFEGEDYKVRRKEIDEEFEAEQERYTRELIEKAQKLGYLIKLTATGVNYYPLKDGKVIKEEEYINLSDEEKKFYEENERKVQLLIDAAVENVRKLESVYKERVRDLNRYALLFATEEFFSAIENKYPYSDVKEYIHKIKEDIIDKVTSTKKLQELEYYFRRAYSVNLIVDNSGLNTAPVVFEDTPTYHNLFGKIEYIEREGMLYTDFTMIRPGSIHKANGGYLILDARELLVHPFVWDRLKKVLFSGQIEVENIDTAYGYSTIATLKTEPVPLKLKVILVGTPEIYELLYEYDPDFEKLFKIKVELDWELDTTVENVKDLISFIADYTKENEILPAKKSALNKVLWYSMRLSGDRTKLSMKLGSIIDLLEEANFFAQKRNSKFIEYTDVHQALTEREDRLKLIVEKYDDMFRKEDLIIDVSGKVVGQVNGLTVVNFGDFEFGLPVRITAKTYLGSSGILDIQREADLSGQIHSKAVMILTGYLGSKYARKVPFSIGVSISFEQVYGYVEGDSASLAEVLAIISAISKIPLKQSIAVTGSINQHGHIQPVGGVTEKVEGFYRICKLKGLTGNQGVIIPRANIRNLVLSDEIIEAIKAGQFHIWTADDVDEAIELMTDKPAGVMTKNYEYPRGTVNYHVVQALKRSHDMAEGKTSRVRKKREHK
ncbi:Lon protease family protein [Fervidobacterium gondwanense]|uniref:endopeptidase La n=1 Tax=Fervidobacterium gondwanense DSM 13020 TaxID=1121883 RepID=A0A1M7RY30_FERGO|nr:ATP-binding protein [Fervidobacterium gondwanense]SHN51229.1 lon-related putative ATP-dependent protease [Fervidobacterium gondwanense DSM 13020]